MAESFDFEKLVERGVKATPEKIKREQDTFTAYVKGAQWFQRQIIKIMRDGGQHGVARAISQIDCEKIMRDAMLEKGMGIYLPPEKSK